MIKILAVNSLILEIFLEENEKSRAKVSTILLKCFLNALTVADRFFIIHIFFVGYSFILLFLSSTHIDVSSIEKASPDLNKRFNLFREYFKRFLGDIHDFALTISSELTNAFKHILILPIEICISPAQIA